ncbi:ATP-binding protein [Streptomyces sp. NPDC059832]|uniref:ATP-binding protein n=1 Tax=Streptomyces sp. NPDC059832 TaxID=3346966 RepID=UPI00365FB381
MGELKNPTWVQDGRPLVLIGDSGTGKSHLLIGIGTVIAETGLTVRCTTTSALVNELAEADAAKRLSSVIARYSKVDLLCLDEFGYLNLDKKGAKLLFQIFTEREEHKATAVATNSPFNEWDSIFIEPRLCAAIADRITFRCTLIQTGTDSYRFQATEADHSAQGTRCPTTSSISTSATGSTTWPSAPRPPDKVAHRQIRRLHAGTGRAAGRSHRRDV